MFHNSINSGRALTGRYITSLITTCSARTTPAPVQTATASETSETNETNGLVNKFRGLNMA